MGGFGWCGAAAFGGELELLFLAVVRAELNKDQVKDCLVLVLCSLPAHGRKAGRLSPVHDLAKSLGHGVDDDGWFAATEALDG
jgi:hypothetical protein